MTPQLDALPMRRSQVQICPHCGHSVLIVTYLTPYGLGASIVDPDPYQRLVANLLVGAAAWPTMPRWCWSPGYARCHVCPDFGGEEARPCA